MNEQPNIEQQIIDEAEAFVRLNFGRPQEALIAVYAAGHRLLRTAKAMNYEYSY